jgi:hypothetical protein
MGVPILTLCGDRITARRTTTLLQAIDRQGLVALSPETYIRRAVELAADIPSLRASRAPLRAAVRASHWCNGPLSQALDPGLRTHPGEVFTIDRCLVKTRSDPVRGVDPASPARLGVEFSC